MMNHYCLNSARGIVILMCALLLSCDTIHEFPNDNAVDPTAINDVTLELIVNAKSIVDADVPLGIPFKHDPDQTLRVIIEVYKSTDLSKRVDRKEIITDLTNPNLLNVHESFLLSSTKYKFFVWMDYVTKTSKADQYYAVPNVRTVRYVEPMMTNTDYLDCFTSSAEIDLAPYKDQWNVSLTVNTTLERPIAKYMIIATDVQKFASKLQAKGVSAAMAAYGIGQYKARVFYNGFMPNGFDASTSQPNDAGEGYSFDADVEIVNDSVALIGFDYQFVNGSSSSIPITLQLINNKGVVTNEFPNINIPLRRGELTIIRGEFFTGNYASGISIDQGFEDEVIEVIIPDK